MKHRNRPLQRHDTWRAGCGESRTSGSEGGPEKPTSREVDRALRPDPYTKLKGPAKWEYFYLYVILDIFSRYVVGWMVAEHENAKLASRLIRSTYDKEGVQPETLVLHADRGSPMKANTTVQLLASLGVERSHNRPHVSNDNPFSESQFKTLKYHPDFPQRFGAVSQALEFCRGFFSWYNQEHAHSGLLYLTPAQVHHGEAEAVLKQRHSVMLAACERHPERFVAGPPKMPCLPDAVWLNPPKEEDRCHDQLGVPMTNGLEMDANSPLAVSTASRPELSGENKTGREAAPHGPVARKAPSCPPQTPTTKMPTSGTEPVSHGTEEVLH